MQALKEALKRHMTKMKSKDDPFMKGDSTDSTSLGALGDRAPEIEGAQSPVVPHGTKDHPQPPNAHASGEDEASLNHLKTLESIMGHGGPLASKAYASAKGKMKEGSPQEEASESAKKEKSEQRPKGFPKKY